MSGLVARLWIGLTVLVALIGTPALAEDRPMGRDWRTGVTVAPGALTWTNDNLANKQKLIGQIASSQGRTCSSNYAFLGWPPGNGGPAVIIPATEENYKRAGYTIESKRGSIATDTIWIARKEDREAVILWGSVSGSTIYLSCLTSGTPAADPDWGLYLGLLGGLGIAVLLAGIWLLRRRSGRAAL